jgi:hypothetical protein
LLTGLSGNGFTNTVTPHLRSIVLNVQRHMAYFAKCNLLFALQTNLEELEIPVSCACVRKGARARTRVSE